MNPSYDLPYTVYMDGGDELRAALIRVCYAAESNHYLTGHVHESTEIAVQMLQYGIDYLKSFKDRAEIPPPVDEPLPEPDVREPDMEAPSSDLPNGKLIEVNEYVVENPIPGEVDENGEEAKPKKRLVRSRTVEQIAEDEAKEVDTEKDSSEE